MVRKHIKRDFSAHKKSVLRPTSEYCKLEIFSYDHPETMYYSLYEGNITGINAEESNCLSWRTLISEDKDNRFSVDCNYSVYDFAQYRIDVLYQTRSDHDYTGFIQIFDDEEKIIDDTYMFDGETNVIKRLTAFYELEKGEYKFRIRLPYNCHFMGTIIRKIKYYSGDSIDSAGTNLMFTNSTVSKSSSVKPSEVSVTIGYDDAFECPLSQSGFYMDFRDEMNVYVKDNEDEIKQIFGGYLSSILPDADRTKLTITGADRLIDGQNKYVLDSMYLLGGTTKQEEYDAELYHDFTNYGEALKFLCDSFESTLQNNINENYLVAGESFENGLAITFGSTGNANNVHVSNMSMEENATFTTLRNDASAEDFQTAYIYDVRDYGIEPVDITDYPNFYLTYGIGDPKREIGECTSGGGNGSNAGKTVVVGCDDNGYNDAGVQDAVITALNNAGYPTERLSIYANAFADYSYKSSANGKIGVYLIAAGIYSIADYYYGAASGGGSFERAIFAIRGDIDSQIGGREPGFSTRGISADPDCPSWLCSKISGMTFPQMNEKLGDRVTIVGGDSAEAIANNVVAACNGDNPGAGNGGGSSGIPVATVFQSITDEAFRYNYCLGCGSSSWSEMSSCGYGDCWAFSEFIFIRLKEYGITCKIVEYGTSAASNHRTVMYADTEGNWIDFPYREYGWNTRYDNMLNNTSGSASGSVVQSFEGQGVNTANGTITGGKRVVGYDKDKPFNFYLNIVFSNDKVHTHDLVVNVTAHSNHENSYGKIDTYWINNVIKQATIEVKSYMADIVGDLDEEEKYYLHQIKLKSPPQVEAHYNTDENNVDEASCKMDLYGAGFNQGTIVNPTDLSSCGKSIISQMESLVKDSGYLVDMEYAQHRKDDVINFMVDNQSEPSYTAKEGDENNILSWGSISYTPVSNLFNNSIYVYKKLFENGSYYRFVNTKDSNSVLRYGEQTTLQTNSEILSDKEAYYNARKKSEKFNPVETYSYTITVPFSPDIDIGDMVKVVADAKKLNTIKKVQSVKYTYDYSKIPRLQTTIGLNELEPDLRLKKTLREMREATKQESTLFSTSAIGIDDANVYQWEK